jgi:hypothetical protein
MDFGQIRLDKQESARNMMFQNSGYQFERRLKKTLILDIVDSASVAPLSTATEFSINLFEPLTVDKLSDIYIDSVSTYNSLLCDKSNRTAFSLNINEFNINSNVASSTSGQQLFNKIIIPNEHNDVNDVHSVVIHKGKKMNYVCSINPGKITKLSGKLTDLGGNSMFSTANTPVGDYKLCSVSLTDVLTHGLESGTIIKINGVDLTVFKGITAYYHTQNSSSIYFYVLVDTAPQTLSNSLEFEFHTNDGSDGSSGQIGGDITTTANSFREGDFPRFTAEFIIEARQ